MRRWAIWLFIAGIALPALPANRVTVEQLERTIATVKSRPDSEVAKQLSALELVERLSSAKLEQLKNGLTGERAQQALLALADASAFSPPPASEIPATAAPDRASQRRIMAQTVDYLGKTLPLLPNLFAARYTTRFESRPSLIDDPASTENSLHQVSKSRVTVLYRDGQEFVDSGVGKDKKPEAPDKGLTTWGEFGPMMGIVVIDAARSKLAWSHWELGEGGPQAVFSYSVPKERSHYDVSFCCVTEAYGLEINVLSQRVGYHGEITVDPDSGTILRLTAIADMEPGNPIAIASTAVEYGPVQIGGRTYFCPVRGIAYARAPDLKALRDSIASSSHSKTGDTLPPIEKPSLSSFAGAPQRLMLNDISFKQYHLFRAESRMVAATGDETAPKASATEITSPQTANPVAAPLPPDSTKPSEDTAVASSGQTGEPAAMPAPVASPTLAPEPLLPEITVTAATGLPQAPAIAPAAAPDGTVTLRLNARLVDVGLVAVDKKGHPVKNLKQEDFEVYDDGHKVNIRSFVQAGAAPPDTPNPSSTSAGIPEQPAFSNRRVDSGKAVGSDASGSTIVLLLDNYLSFGDLTNVRDQMLRFLGGLPASERVALYAMRTGNVDVLEEGTTDHASLAATLKKWSPIALNIARGEFEEARNRQTLETVHNMEDLLTTNGNQELDAGTNFQPLDAQLRELGSNPARDALTGLIDVARHLAAIPGHKSLVWITSDNVLADWTKMSVSIDKGSRKIDASSLRTQEALNNAHVSIYPLDASRLEASVINASIGRRNVELTPTNQMVDFPVLEKEMQGPEFTAGYNINTQPQRDLNPGRLTAAMQQDLHPIQGAFREVADATGGRIFRRAADLTSELNDVAADGRATYLLSFTPTEAADGKYHLITVKLPSRHDINLRYRTGYLYKQESSTLKERFRDAAVNPEDATEIALTANPQPSSNSHSIMLQIATRDLELAQKDSLWTDNLDVYLVQRDVDGSKARISGQTLGLHLKPATYEKYLREGISFNQVLESTANVESVRIVVLDRNSGRMGSITIPAAAISAKQ